MFSGDVASRGAEGRLLQICNIRWDLGNSKSIFDPPESLSVFTVHSRTRHCGKAVDRTCAIFELVSSEPLAANFRSGGKTMHSRGIGCVQGQRQVPRSSSSWNPGSEDGGSGCARSSRARESVAMAAPHCSNSPSRGGELTRQVLSNEGRTKLNTFSDRSFYSSPRFVTHVDDKFLSTLTALYRERVPQDAEILDLMSSWVSHLPADAKYKRVVGHGLNAAELNRNHRLDHFFVKDLNEDTKLEAADCSFDAVLCTVSVQYLQQPEKVFAEIYRVLRPGGVCIVSFSNRMFYEKAVASWRDGSPYGRTRLVVQYFQCVVGFTEPQVVRKLSGQSDSSKASSGNPLLSWFGRLFDAQGSDPFYAVIAYRNFKPL